MLPISNTNKFHGEQPKHLDCFLVNVLDDLIQNNEGLFHSRQQAQQVCSRLLFHVSLQSEKWAKQCGSKDNMLAVLFIVRDKHQGYYGKYYLVDSGGVVRADHAKIQQYKDGKFYKLLEDSVVFFMRSQDCSVIHWCKLEHLKQKSVNDDLLSLIQFSAKNLNNPCVRDINYTLQKGIQLSPQQLYILTKLIRCNISPTYAQMYYINGMQVLKEIIIDSFLCSVRGNMHLIKYQHYREAAQKQSDAIEAIWVKLKKNPKPKDEQLYNGRQLALLLRGIGWNYPGISVSFNILGALKIIAERGDRAFKWAREYSKYTLPFLAWLYLITKKDVERYVEFCWL